MKSTMAVVSGATMLARMGSLARCSGANGNGSNEVTLESYTRAELAFFAMHLAQIGLGLDAAAGILHELRVEAGHLRHALIMRFCASASERPFSSVVAYSPRV